MEKSEKLEGEIRKLGYIVNHGIASHDKSLFVISGRTTEMKMMHETLKEWIGAMFDLGHKYDCNFDSWRIAPGSK